MEENPNRKTYFTLTSNGMSEIDVKSNRVITTNPRSSINNNRNRAKYFIYRDYIGVPPTLYKDGEIYKKNISTFTGYQLINDYNEFITELSNMKQEHFFNDQELEDLLLTFVKSINLSYDINSNYDLSLLYNENFFENKIKNLTNEHVIKLKEICEKIVNFLNQIQYNYVDISGNANGTKQKDIVLFNKVIKLLDEEEMEIPLSEHLKKIKDVNSSLASNIP